MEPTSASQLPRFLEKLKKITETTPKKIARWSKDGARYEIHHKSFEVVILPKHFDAKQTLLSFSRQLNYYGFKKIDKLFDNKTSTQSKKFVPWGISHPMFQRDAPHLIYKIKRKTRKERSDLASKSEVQEVRKELEQLSDTLTKDLRCLKKQLEQLQDQVNDVLITAQPPSPVPFHEYEQFLPLHSDNVEKAFLKQISCMTFPENSGLKRKRESVSFL